MTAIFMSIREERVTQSYLMKIRAKGYTAGVYAAWNWDGYEGTGQHFAEQVSARLGEIVPITSAQNFPKVQLDAEIQDPLWIQNMVVRWRQLRKYRDTSWTMEPFQGGWMSPNMVNAVISRRVRVVPQCYYGTMTPVPVEPVIDDLTKMGFPRALVTPMYDAAALPSPWNGFAYTQGRLPFKT